MAQLVLASASPRRRELLDQIGVQYTCAPQDIDESIHGDEQAGEYVERLAREKALSGAKQANIPVLGSDTCVVLDNKILGKPVSKEHAIEMLRGLSGRQHQVLTGIAICQGDQCISQVVTTNVTFITLSREQIEAYIVTLEPMDKAGAYGIQGKAAVFIESISGSYSNVVGLPLTETAQLLHRFNVPIWSK